MPKTEVLILGAGKAARYVAYIYSYYPDVTVFGFTDQNPDVWQHNLYGAQVLGSDEFGLEHAYQHGVRHVVVGVGAPALRAKLRSLAHSRGFSLLSAVHPSAIISRDVKIGHGTVIEAGCVLSDNPIISENVWIGLAVTVCHDTYIGKDSSIGGGATIGGEVTIGECSQIGLAAIVQPGRAVGSNATVGSGANVVSDIPDDVVVVGNPAKVLRQRGN
jgi:sugar O-acyltransferase (sialic acid O-acetyltransferase NeuD family)